MATKNTKSIAAYFTLENVIDTASLVNLMALNTVEKGFNKGLGLAEKLQGVSNKNIKKGLKFTAKKQEELFDTLETSKEKMTSLFGKK